MDSAVRNMTAYCGLAADGVGLHGIKAVPEWIIEPVYLLESVVGAQGCQPVWRQLQQTATHEIRFIQKLIDRHSQSLKRFSLELLEWRDARLLPLESSELLSSEAASSAIRSISLSTPSGLSYSWSSGLSLTAL